MPFVGDFKSSDAEAPFLDLHLTISDCLVSSKIYDKRDDFDLDIVKFPFFMGIFLAALQLTGLLYHSLLGLLECRVMSLTLTLEIKF